MGCIEYSSRLSARRGCVWILCVEGDILGPFLVGLGGFAYCLLALYET